MDTALRECKEELGIDITYDEIELIMSYRRSYDFVDIWLVRKDIVVQEDEVSEVKWASFEEIEEIEELINNNKTSENVKAYFNFFKDFINRYY